MKPVAFLILGLFLVNTNMGAQSGCTDPVANNFNPSAISNDGSCTYDVTTLGYNTKGPLYTFCTESSGVVFTDGYIWTHNDSGNPPELFKVDTANGNLVQKVTITNFPNTDWEDITADSNYIYIGDFGNNNGDRKDLKVLKVAKSALTSTATIITVTAQAINFSYSDQTSFTSNSNTNFDCEALLSLNGSLYLFTKDRGDFQTRVYRLSKTPGTYTLSPYTSYNVNGKITGADYNKQKNEVALIGYMASSKNSFIYLLNNFSGDMFFSGNKRRIEIGNSTNDWQTEGICYGASSNELFMSCESSYTVATLYNCFKSNMVALGLSNYQKNTDAVQVFPNPCSGGFTIKSDVLLRRIELVNTDGKVLLSKDICANEYSFSANELVVCKAGVYVVRYSTESQTAYQKIVLTNGM